MAKPTKPTWADGDPSYVIEPGAGKKTVGWTSGEKPPYQYMNWIHFQTKEWLDYVENKAETISPTMLQSTGTATWDGATLTLSQPLNVSFRVTLGEQVNRIPAAAYALGDGEVLVLKKDKTNPSPVTVTNGSYGSLGAAQYDIVAESALTADDHENETVLFRRRGTNLECPINGTIWATGETITFGRSSGIPSVITDHGALSGLGDDDHTQYSLANGTRAFSGVVSGVTPTLSAHLATKGYVDSAISGAVVTDHGALSGLGDDDHTQYSLVDGTRAFTGTILLPDTDPPTAGRMARRSAVRAWGFMSDTGTVLSSFNIDAVASGQTSTGDYDWVIDVNMSTGNYAVGASCDDDQGPAFADNFMIVHSKAITGFSVHIEDNSGGNVDADHSVIVCGAQ